MKPILINTERYLLPISPANDKTFTLEEMYDLIGCTTVEVITLPNGLELWVDENGKMDGKPINEIATLLWQTIYHGYAWGADDIVVGNAILCEPHWTAR